MKYNDIMPECFIDTTLVGSLLDANVSHKHSCNEVAREMEKGKYKDAFAVGIIDNDKRKLSYIEGFEKIGQTDNLTFLKHRNKHQYVIKDSVSTLKDPRILKLCKTMRQSPEVAKLQNVLEYLATYKYNADIEAIKKMI